jgi:formamidase
MKSIEIDRTKSLLEEPEKGHNRFHPDIPPVIEVEQGEEVILETRSATDNQLKRSSVSADLLTTDSGRLHPLTGPVYVKGAHPGDLLEIEFLDIAPSDWAFTGVRPGRGYLKDEFADPFSRSGTWRTAGRPRSRCPVSASPVRRSWGVATVAPSQEQFVARTKREADLLALGGAVRPPDPHAAVPGGRIGEEGLRTGPPRENGGNMDVKQMTQGSKLLLPVGVEGALFSTGDAHFAQGDGEVCLQAVEMDATTTVRSRLLEGEGTRHRMRGRTYRTRSFSAIRDSPCHAGSRRR